MLEYRNALWLGTSAGLYQYRSEENTWAARTAATGLRDDSITALAADDDAIWIGTRHCVNVLDLRNNTILTYDTADGIPAGAVLAIAFEKDYVWLGTERGAARYDRLIERWQTIDARGGLIGTAVYAIVAVASRVYLVTDAAVNEYDPSFERWRSFVPAEGALGATDAVAANTALWIFRATDVLLFSSESKVFKRYTVGGADGLRRMRHSIVAGEGLHVVTDDDLWMYDAPSDAFRPFREIAGLPERNILCAALSSDGAAVTFSTPSGISRWLSAEKRWEYYTEAGGMPFSEFFCIHDYGDELVGAGRADLAVYRKDDSRWYSRPLVQPSAEESRARVSIDPAAGTYADFGGGYKISLTGSRTSWLFNDPFHESSASFHSGRTESHTDAKATLDLPGGRSINAMYNDVDYELVRYGVEYRGASDDALQTAQWGDVRLEKGNRALLQSFGLFGGAARAVFGPVTQTYHRSLVEVTATAGHATTAIAHDFFTGTARRQRVALRDVDYQTSLFFSIADSGKPLAPDASVEIFERARGGVTRERAMDRVIAGVKATWDRLYAGLDYTFSINGGWVRFSVPVGRFDTIAVRIFEGRGMREFLLVASDRAREMRNVYFLFGAEILPSSFRMTMHSENGAEIPIAAYGLDADRDGRVDASRIDYRNGLLFFPMARPFPPETYADSARSRVSMAFDFETELNGYRLAHSGLIRGSERIIVDRIEVRPGSDYILDYTSGFLLFTRDGVVLDDSRIEITYEYVRVDPKHRTAQAGVLVSPSDYTQAGLMAGTFRTPGSTRDIAFVNAQAEARYKTEEIDVRVVPEYMHTRSDSARGDALSMHATASGYNARVSLLASRRSEGHRDLFERLFLLGALRGETAIAAEYDIIPELRLFADWNERNGKDTANGTPVRDLFSGAGVQWIARGLPSITIRGERISDDGPQSRHRRIGLRGDLEYAASDDLLRALGLSSAAITVYARNAVEEQNTAGLVISTRTENYYLRTVVSPVPLFSVNAWYRGDARFSDAHTAASGGGRAPEQTRERILVDVVLEHLRGLSAGLRLSGDLAYRYDGSSAASRDEKRASTAQLTARFSPGSYVDALSPFVFELNVQNSAQRYTTGAEGFRPLFLSLFRAVEGRILSCTDGWFYETKIEWRPEPSLFCSVTGRLNETGITSYSSAVLERRRDLIPRADFHPDSRTLYSAQVAIADGGNPWSAFSSWSPLVWMEHRWTEALLVRFTLSALSESRRMWAHRFEQRQVSPSANVTLTVPDLPLSSRVEVRDDCAFAWHSSESIKPYAPPIEMSIQRTLTNTAYLDVYILTSSYLRLMHTRQWNFRKGIMSIESSYTSLQLVIQL